MCQMGNQNYWWRLKKKNSFSEILNFIKNNYSEWETKKKLFWIGLIYYICTILWPHGYTRHWFWNQRLPLLMNHFYMEIDMTVKNNWFSYNCQSRIRLIKLSTSSHIFLVLSLVLCCLWICKISQYLW